MSIDWMEKLARIAEEMNRIHAVPGAEMRYDVTADAIFWTDEYPANLAGRAWDFQCVKILLRYRTSVLTGQPDETFGPYWDRARQLFPNWAGFEPKRFVPTDEMIEFYDHHKDRDLRTENGWLARYRTERR